MKRRNKQYEHPTLFITGNIARNIPLFLLWPEANNIFLENINFYRKKYGFLLLGYVLMPDHYHLLLSMKQNTSMTDFLRDFKSFVGKKIVSRLNETGQKNLLERFQLNGKPQRHKDARYKILQSDNHIVEIFTPRIFRGKLEYIHNNPVKKGLVSEPGQWQYSSWHTYEVGEESPIRIDKLEDFSL